MTDLQDAHCSHKISMRLLLRADWVLRQREAHREDCHILPADLICKLRQQPPVVAVVHGKRLERAVNCARQRR